MFRTITKKIINDTKESVKEEASKKADKIIPAIIGVTAVTVALFSMFEPMASKISSSRMTTINNFYIYIGGVRR